MKTRGLLLINVFLVIGSFVAALFVTDIVIAQSQPFYQGKTVRIVVGFTPGGFYDRWARLLARYLPKYIPGNPEFIVQNMPGASSVIAANYVYNVALPDGLTLGMSINSLYLDQLVGRKEAKYDVRKYEWIGSQEKSFTTLYFRADSPYQTIDDVVKSKEPPKCGSTGTASTSFILPKVLEETLGAKFTIVLGYPGGSEIDLAVQKGEVVCRGQDINSHSGREPFLTWHKTGFDRHLMQDGPKHDPRVPDAPTLREIMDRYNTPAGSRKVAQIILSTGELGRPLMATPGTPADRVKILRDAYAQALSDPSLIDEAKRGRMEMELTRGEVIQKLMNEVIDQPADIIARVKKVLSN
jgi:tripartite-type tricarboxylate transporter receptor subunit TctC